MALSHRGSYEALLPLLTGLGWLWYAGGATPMGLIFALLPGLMLSLSGGSLLLRSEAGHSSRFAALGGLLGTVIALPILLSGKVLMGFCLLMGSMASFLIAGMISVRRCTSVEEVPAPKLSARLGAEVAIDETMLGMLEFSIPILLKKDPGSIGREVQIAHELFQERGWLDMPAAYHRTPPALTEPHWHWRRAAGVDFEQLSFASDYEPWPDEPGSERWLGYSPNCHSYAWILRQPDPGRPWLLCIHGQGMGVPQLDLRAFRAMQLYRRFGLNLAFPILPLHGPRTVGRWPRETVFSGDILDAIHAEAQALWDLRRLLTWIRAQGAIRIGVYGISLGGYSAALLASLDSDLAGVIAGIPASDITDLIAYHISSRQRRRAERAGLQFAELGAVMRVVSPLALTPCIPRARRAIFGAVADRIVPASQVYELWLHWERPALLWYQGSHLSSTLHKTVAMFVEDRLRQAELIQPLQ
ncbi:MAG TPA: alpha/beta hydrolase [Candidatus Competibacteraceae bacterium]|nr:alpha/beta hydrolase [Candidatus Competibacteraceae bacterium]